MLAVAHVMLWWGAQNKVVQDVAFGIALGETSLWRNCCACGDCGLQLAWGVCLNVHGSEGSVHSLMAAIHQPRFTCTTMSTRPAPAFTLDKQQAHQPRRRTASTAVATSQTEQLLAPAPEQPSPLIKVAGIHSAQSEVAALQLYARL